MCVCTVALFFNKSEEVTTAPNDDSSADAFSANPLYFAKTLVVIFVPIFIVENPSITVLGVNAL